MAGPKPPLPSQSPSCNVQVVRDTDRATPTAIPVSPERRVASAFANQRQWVQRIGALDTMARPRTIFREGGLVAALTGTSGAIMLPDAPAGKETALQNALQWLRHGGSGDVLIWAAAPDLAVDRWLSARGARPGFQPLWMYRDLRDPIALPRGEVATVCCAGMDDLPLLLKEAGIPYTTAWQARATHHLATTSPGDAQLLLAMIGNRLVGRAMVNLTRSGLDRCAGFYDLAVHPDVQRLGIGTDLTRAALSVAREAGADIATLNSTPAGAGMYRGAGFVDSGYGQTWTLTERILRRPPADGEIRFAMCLAAGEMILPAWHRFSRAILPNGESPLALAARFHQPGSARQLLSLGTVPDIAAVWQVGLHDHARAMMADPAALHARRDAEGATPLHTAIRLRDDDLLAALLDAGANPHLKDRGYQSDAWGWAAALGNDSALSMLNARFPGEGATW